jgi:hypothetical protein
MKKIILVLALSLISTPSFAEEAPADQSGWDAESGWAVVDDSGVVQNIIVCTNAVCGENGLFGGVMPSDNSPTAGMRIIRQIPAGPNGNFGGAWGTYDSNTETFTVDRGCATCEVFSDVFQKGIIKNGILVQPVIIPGLDTYMINNPDLTIDEAADLLKDILKNNYDKWLEINAKKSSAIVGLKNNYVEVKKTKNRKIQLTDNLKQFKKVSRTIGVCKISKNSVVIVKSGTCKIDLYKEGKRERVTTKVKK